MTARAVLDLAGMRPALTTALATLVLGSSLVACGTTADDDGAPDTLDDSKSDSFSRPTKFGRLHKGVWQFGELDPDSNTRFATWEFDLSGDASVDLFAREEPSDEPQFTEMELVLYKQRDDGTFRRIATHTAGGAFGPLARTLGEGTYRVLVKGTDRDTQGRFLVRMDCTGEGCVDDAQCMFGDSFSQNLGIHNGGLIDFGTRRLTAASIVGLPATMRAQIIAALHESTHDDVTTIEQAFDAVDGGEINLISFLDDMTGRTLNAVEYGAGDNSFGAIFVGSEPTVAASIHDGDIAECTLQPRACVFGESRGDAEFMPEMRLVRSFDVSDADVEPRIATKIIAAIRPGEDNVLDVLLDTDDASVFVEELEHRDGRKFVAIHFHAGDTPVGSFFPDDSDVPVAEISDGDVVGCTAFY